MKLPKNNWFVLVERRLSTNNVNGVESGVKAIATEKATQLVDSVKRNMTSSIQFVDDTLGVTEVSKAQEEVSTKESDFLLARKQVEELRSQLDKHQDILTATRKKLDRTDRENENYLAYVADEHKVLLQVQDLTKSYNSTMNKERTAFVQFSSAVRLSHEKERSRAERTKYWSIIGSVSGTVLGFLLSSIVTHYRLKGVKEITMETLVDSTKTLQDAIHDGSSYVLSEMKELMVNGGGVSTASDATKLMVDRQKFEDDLLAPLQEQLHHFKEESIKIEQLLKNLDQKLVATISSASQLLQKPTPSSFSTPPLLVSSKPGDEVLSTGDSEKPNNKTNKVFAKSTTGGKEDSVSDAAAVDVAVDQVLDNSLDIQVAPHNQNTVVQYAPLLAVLGSGALLIYSMFNE